MALVSINWDPTCRQLRQFAVLGGVLFLALAGWLYQQHGTTPYVWSLVIIGIGFGGIGVLWPESMRYLYVGLMAATFPIGWTISLLILLVIYYGVFTLVAGIFRLIGRDALQRQWEPAAATYWQPKQMPTDMRQYLRQY